MSGKPGHPRIVAAGDNVVDCYNALGVMFPGGNCVNVAVFAHRFGAETHYIGRVGADAAGEHIRASLSSEGVGTEALRTVPNGDTAHCIIGHVDGDRVFVSSSKGVSVFEPNPADLELIGASDAVHVGATSSLDAWVPEFASRTRLSYDFAIFRDQSHIERIAPLAYLATFSGGDLTDVEADALLERALAAGAAHVLVTRGERGALLAARADFSTGGPAPVEASAPVVAAVEPTLGAETAPTRTRLRWSTAAAPAQVVDTLGAGDTFVARVLTGLLRGESPDDLLSAAARAAAETCGAPGAFGRGIPIALDPEVLRTSQPVDDSSDRAPSSRPAAPSPRTDSSTAPPTETPSDPRIKEPTP